MKDRRVGPKILGLGLAGLLLGYVALHLAVSLHRTPGYLQTRFHQDLNRLTLQGKTAPALDEEQYLGPKPASLEALRGKPVLIYFWAHWCGPCRLEAPILATIKTEYAAQGLTLIGPTQLYGYVARGEDATPEQELAYIEQVRERYYAGLLDVPVPISEKNFAIYGALATPTLVFVDRRGVVQLYHPNEMTEAELDAAVRKIVAN